ncbi:hypothetical protein J2Y58_002088 [Sphingomonas sp. BE138]|uniref:hypothetical protein n=1 Tax=Sphingomonas sp. BE138 TaxID=2817845 RepID=UPI00285704B5|nr:hypothetical protein [Sphingomonas sp. BE138]MDR6788723.1 hypothetical protein [Sphingomonas sp. BE138]
MEGKKTLADVLAEIANDRQQFLAVEDEERRHIMAADALTKAMFFVYKLLGNDMLSAAIGTVDEDDPVSVLKVASARLLIYASLFKDLPEDKASPIRIIEEAMAIANGDTPVTFAKLEMVPTTKHREHRLKLRAISWDAYLRGRGMSSVDRAWTIGKAFNADWSTINTSWRRDIRPLGEHRIEFSIAIAERAGRNGVANWETVEIAYARIRDPASTEGLEDWELALKLDAQQLQDARRIRGRKRR